MKSSRSFRPARGSGTGAFETTSIIDREAHCVGAHYFVDAARLSTPVIGTASWLNAFSSVFGNTTAMPCIEALQILGTGGNRRLTVSY
jgi:hypothetical protein